MGDGSVLSLKDSGGGAGLDLTAIINATTINISYSSSLIYNTYDYILFSIGQLGGKTLTVIFNINEGLILFIGLDPSTTSSRVYNPYAYYGNWQFVHSNQYTTKLELTATTSYWYLFNLNGASSEFTTDESYLRITDGNHNVMMYPKTYTIIGTGNSDATLLCI